MFNYFRTITENFGALILVFLVLSQPAFAQEDFNTLLNSLTLKPGVYTVVLNGQIVDLQPIASFFTIAQFGSTEASSQSTPITPGSPRINGEPDHSAELTAQLVKVLFDTPSSSPTLVPGLDTMVFNGQTVVGQPLNNELDVGEFGFTQASNQPTLISPGPTVRLAEVFFGTPSNSPTTMPGIHIDVTTGQIVGSPSASTIFSRSGGLFPDTEAPSFIAPIGIVSPPPRMAIPRSGGVVVPPGAGASGTGTIVGNGLVLEVDDGNRQPAPTNAPGRTQNFEPNAAQPGSITGTSQFSTTVATFSGAAVQAPPAPSGSLVSGVLTQPAGDNALGLEVDGGDRLQDDQDRAITAAMIACSSGTPDACDGALRALVVTTRALYADATAAVLQNNLLVSFRQVIAAVRASPGAAGTRAINIATIDDVFAQLVPENTATRPSSPS